MAENADQFSEANKTDECDGESTAQELVIALKLPADLKEKLQHYSQRSGKTQVEIILAVLKSAFAGIAPEAPSADAVSLQMQQELRSLKVRLSELEALMPRLEKLEGKWMAF